MNKVLEFNGVTRLSCDPQRVIEHALAAGLTNVVIVGFNADGSEYFRASDADGGDVLWLLERARHKLLSIADE